MEESGPSQKNQVVGLRVSHGEIPLSGKRRSRLPPWAYLGSLPGFPAPDKLSSQCLKNLEASRNGEACLQNWKLKEGKSQGVEPIFPEVTLRPRALLPFLPTACVT